MKTKLITKKMILKVTALCLLSVGSVFAHAEEVKEVETEAHFFYTITGASKQNWMDVLVQKRADGVHAIPIYCQRSSDEGVPTDVKKIEEYVKTNCKYYYENSSTNLSSGYASLDAMAYQSVDRKIIFSSVGQRAFARPGVNLSTGINNAAFYLDQPETMQLINSGMSFYPNQPLEKWFSIYTSIRFAHATIHYPIFKTKTIQQ